MGRQTVEAGPIRLDRVVASLSGVGSRARGKRAITTGKVQVDGQTVTEPGHTLAAGSVVDLDWNRPTVRSAPSRVRRELERLGVGVLFEDRWVVVFDKPSGLLTDAATGAQRRTRQTLRGVAAAYLESEAVRPAHRIDRDTTGAVLFAKDREGFELLRTQFRARTPERVYDAFVQGEGVPVGHWTDVMAWDHEARLQRRVSRGHEGAFEAHCDVVLVSEHRGISHLEVRLETGRRNQIRVMAALRDCPLVGERQYLPSGWKHKGVQRNRQALHSRRIGVDHPHTGDRLVVDSPLPADLQPLRNTRGG